MKSLRIFVFVITLLLIPACGRSSNEEMSFTPTPSSVSIRPAPSNTAQPTKAALPTQTIVPTPDLCSKETVSAEIVGASQLNHYVDKLIAYTVENEQNSDEIFVANWQGQNERNITNNSADEGYPRWSPDGERIAFLSNRNSPLKVSCNGAGDECKYELFVIRANGSGLKQITKGWTFFPSWSPDGQQIVFVGAFKSELSPNSSDPFLYDIFVVNSDGSNLRNLTDSPGYYFDSVWSPDGKFIAFQSQSMAAFPNSINIISADGTSLSAYSDKQANEIVWSSDGTSLLFASHTNEVFGNDIYRLKADLSSLKQLTFSPLDRKESLSLSPNGKWLAYHLRSDYQHPDSMCDQIRVLNTETLKDYFVYDAKDIEKITLDDNGTSPLYYGLSISSIIWTPDNQLLIFRQGYQIPGIFGSFNGTFSIRLDGSQLEILRTNIKAIQP